MRIVEWMPILPGYLIKIIFIQCRADQSTIRDFNYYENKCQHIEIKKNNKSLKHVKEIWTVLFFWLLLVLLKIRLIGIREIDDAEGKETIQKFLCKQ